MQRFGAREKDQGRVLAEFAEELCVTQRYLRAIEADDLKVLPGIFFYKSFVRQYAAILKLDRKQIDAALAQLDAVPEPSAVEVPKPIAESKPLAMAAAAAVAGLGRFVEQPVSDPSYRPPVRKLDPLVAEGNKDYFSDRKVGVSVAALVFALLLCTGLLRVVEPASRLYENYASQRLCSYDRKYSHGGADSKGH